MFHLHALVIILYAAALVVIVFRRSGSPVCSPWLPSFTITITITLTITLTITSMLRVVPDSSPHRANPINTLQSYNTKS